MFGMDFGFFNSLPFISEMSDQEALTLIDNLKNEYYHLDSEQLEYELECEGIDIAMLSPRVRHIINQGW